VAQALIPPGTILPYGGTTAPPGYLICAGQSYAKSTYPALAAALGNAFGGDASTFRIPDLRGRFLRGTDDPDGGGSSFFAAGRDPDGASRSSMNMGGSSGNAVGSVQGDQFKLHSHPGSSTNASRFTNTTPTPSGTGGYGAGWVTGTISITPEGGNETRPINAYVNFIIKL
jgi:microcystin-dependent protein